MNPALTPLSRIREMTNAELVAFAKEHSHLTILEQEFVKRLSVKTNAEAHHERYTAGILNGAIVRSK